MKIAHIVDYFHPLMGYQENHLSRIQSSIGHKVLIVTGKSFTPWCRQTNQEFTKKIENGDKELQKINIQIKRMDNIFEYSHRIYLKGLKDIFEEFNPDLVHVHGFFTINALQCSYLKVKFIL